MLPAVPPTAPPSPRGLSNSSMSRRNSLEMGMRPAVHDNDGQPVRVGASPSMPALRTLDVEIDSTNAVARGNVRAAARNGVALRSRTAVAFGM